MATNILSIDGGGIRGVIPAMVLAHIEEKVERPIAELFDVIAGTSTGGLIALGLTRPGAGGRPKFSAGEVVAIYEDDGRTIFPHETFGRLRQFVEEKLTKASEAMDDASDENLENLKLEAVDLIARESARLDEICRALSR
jgi:patatin-like phospholipase/acyl hydrolase